MGCALRRTIVSVLVALVASGNWWRRGQPGPAVSEGQRELRRHVRRRHLEGMIECEGAPTMGMMLLLQWKCRVNLSVSEQRQGNLELPFVRSRAAPKERDRELGSRRCHHERPPKSGARTCEAVSLGRALESRVLGLGTDLGRGRGVARKRARAASLTRSGGPGSASDPCRKSA